MAIARMSQIRTHRRDDAVSLLQHPVTADTVIEKQTKDNKPEPLNLIFSPTAQQVSDEDNKLLELMESGLHNLRDSVSILTKLIHLLPEDEKKATFTVDKQDYSVNDMLDSLNQLIIDGEKQQRIMIQGTAEILHRLALPNPKSQATQQS